MSVDQLRRRAISVHGVAGAAWIEALPRLRAEVHAAWGLRADGALPLSYAHVERVVRVADDIPAVLKLCLPGDPEAAGEAPALAAFAGDGAARLLAHDPAHGALLLERLEPGTQLVELAARDDDAATDALADVMARLWRPPPVGDAFPRVRDWGRALEGPAARDARIPRPLVARARAAHAELCATASAPVLLHGDLHHFNVLRAGAGWKAIDPKGVVGEPAYEVGALLRNPVPALLDAPRPRRLLERRLDRLSAALALDRERLRAWAAVQAVLSAVWAVEGGEEPAFWLACAELLQARL